MVWTRLCLGVGLALALSMAAKPARADFSGCDTAIHTSDPREQVRLYTLCINSEGGGNRAGGYNNRGVAYDQLGEVDNALSDFTNSIANDSKWATPYINRGRIYLARGERDKAEADFDRALKLQPNTDWAYAYVARGELKAGRGDCLGAIDDFEQAQHRKHKLASAYEFEAFVLAACADAKVRDGARALVLAQKAATLDKDPLVHDVLAAAYAEQGQFDDAVREQTQAIQLDPGKTNISVVDRDKALARYQAKKPVRMSEGAP